jgi:hypothetical protein
MSSLYLEIIFSGGHCIREDTRRFRGADYLSFASFSKRRFLGAGVCFNFQKIKLCMSFLI